MEKTTQNESEKKSFISELFCLAKTNIRDYMMYIALVIIMIFFNWKTQGAFTGSQHKQSDQAGRLCGSPCHRYDPDSDFEAH